MTLLERYQDGLLPINTETKFGRVKAIGFISGERYYWMLDEDGSVSMIDDETAKISVIKENLITA